MWTGGKPPPIPATKTLLRSSSPTFRNNIRDAELEALRQRGLAKLLNKHFSDTAEKLASEKAAADAALADLEARKATDSRFEITNGNTELSPFDSMYLSVHQWRNECRRKERETLLLYQSYVHKFGAYGQVKIPSTNPATPLTTLTPTTTACSTSSSSNTTPPSPAISARLSAPPPSRTPPPPLPSSHAVPAMTAAIESTLEDYMRTGAISMPSIEVLGKDQTLQGQHTKEEAEFRNFYRRQLEAKGIDARASPTMLSERQQVYTGTGAFDPNPAYLRTIDGAGGPGAGAAGWQDHHYAATYKGDGLAPLYIARHDQDDDDLSVMSGLTMNTAMTREVMHEVESTVLDFLKNEQASIRKIMEEEEEDLDSTSVSNEDYPSVVGSTSGEAAQQAEDLASQMELILTQYESESQAPSPKKEPRRLETDNEEEQWMVYYDETYQRDYYHELKSNRTQWEPPTEDGCNTISSPLISHSEVMPDEFEGRSTSRIVQYRRMRRRRRRRRILGLAVLAAASLTGGAVYLQTNPEAAQQVSNWYVVQMTNEAVHKYVDMASLESMMAKTSLQMRETVEWVTGQADRRLALESQARVAAERDLLAERQARQVADAKVQAQRKAQADLKASKQAERSISIPVKQQAPVAPARPWGCNVPLAYAVHGKCRRLAKENPIYDLQELINAMMQ